MTSNLYKNIVKCSKHYNTQQLSRLCTGFCFSNPPPNMIDVCFLVLVLLMHRTNSQDNCRLLEANMAGETPHHCHGNQPEGR